MEKTTKRNQGLKKRAVAMMAIAIFGLMGCANEFEAQFDDARDIASVPGDDNGKQDDGGGTKTPVPTMKTVTLKEDMNIRTLKNNVLEFVIELPAGSVLRYYDETSSQNYDYRTSGGGVERSSTGFLYPIHVLSVPASAKARIPDAKLSEINSASGGVYVSASISGEILRSEETFPIIAGGTPGAGFTKYYETSGKPKFSYVLGVKKRFGDRVNKGIAMTSLSAADQAKWTKIYNELKRAGDRKAPSPRELMIIDSATAKNLSIKFEKEGFVNNIGAWSVAVEGTATRHGFANVPCAETMSEVIRQAYKRAGYSHTEDFNATKGNKLYWTSTAAVVELSRSLNAAGWVPWDYTMYRAPAGAIMMHTTGISPGHTYMSGGDDGRIIVDNGSPKGRDLRVTSQSIIAMMYQTGVFFLPPGIQPTPW